MASIQVNPKERTFHLTNKYCSYLFRVMENGQLEHLYYGKKMEYLGQYDRFIERSYRSVSVGEFDGDLVTSLESIKQEFPSSGSGDFREPAVEIIQEDGSHIMEFIFDRYEVITGKPKIPHLPATFCKEADEAETLLITLTDSLTGAVAVLAYTIFSELPVITRSVSITNSGNSTLRVNRLMSMSLDLPDSEYEFVHLSGAWGRERHVERTPLRPGVQSIGSTRGISSHIHNPFMALAKPGSQEHQGEVYAVNLVYSGNFLAQAEVDSYSTTRLSLGIHPDKFCWTLKPGECFYSPEAVMVYSQNGLNGMSQAFHRLYNKHLIRSSWAERERPVLINNWEGTYFDFTEKKIVDMAKKASELGIELFVLDDGWFGQRNNDTSSLGDWFENREKLPNGISNLAKKINELGMKFGLWFEPEMVNSDSHIMREHPDWVVGTPGRKRKHGRHQYVLDYSQPPVVNYLFKLMDDVLSSAHIEYVKWDMNRCISEAYSLSLGKERQGEFFHRYVLGVYALYEKLITKYPEILFESCASGGGRFDPGMLYYAPQTWTSDDSEAIERLKIQYGTSMAYPLSSMGAHVSTIPNHQVGRTAPLQTRSNVAYFGVFGYELDPLALTEEECNIIKKQIQLYKRHQRLVTQGTFYRLLSPFEKNETAWMTIDAEREHALVGWYQVLSRPNAAYSRLKLIGLDEKAVYFVEELDRRFTGSELMNIGLILTPPYQADQDFNIAEKYDFSSQLFTLTKETSS
ncbi:alpha-galactosidase [Paenibacillus polymyxa]|uniref:alpha-galactosidase n=1 Tax=Paenibacillus polymyxa TaxID=1406 RepID=UPI000ED44C73|nr:alpha-galactosidase [Paenibacillus polymyxa]RGL31081.1 alpha-galactosidase [Paenibacillus polymyxa]UMR38104.1 alpha-galactosidase [Paenibacillus polymyxa]